MPPIERCPTGGYFSFSTTSRASSGEPTCGDHTPRALSSSRRLRGDGAFVARHAHDRRGYRHPARQRRSAPRRQSTSCRAPGRGTARSKPAVFIAMAISTLRRQAQHGQCRGDSSPFSSFARATPWMVGMAFPFGIMGVGRRNTLRCSALRDYSVVFAWLPPPRVDGGGDDAIERREVHRMVGFVGNRCDKPMAAQDENAPVDALRLSAVSVGRFGKLFADRRCWCSCRGVAARFGTGQRQQSVVHPALQQQALAHPTRHPGRVEHAKFGVVAQRGETGPGASCSADAVSGVLRMCPCRAGRPEAGRRSGGRAVREPRCGRG